MKKIFAFIIIVSVAAVSCTKKNASVISEDESKVYIKIESVNIDQQVDKYSQTIKVTLN